MNFNHDSGLIDTILTIDTTTAPPLGGETNSLAIVGSGSLHLPIGTNGQRPTNAAGMLRYNTDVGGIEFNNGSVWLTLSSGGGTVSSVTVTASNAGLSVSGGTSQTINSTGTFALTLDAGLESLATLSSTGIIVQSASNTFITRTIAGTASNVSVSNGDGVSGNPTIDLIDAGSPITNSFVKITTDAKGRVTASAAVGAGDITPLVDATYVNVSGDSMTSAANLTFSGGGEVLGLPATPTTSGSATSKAYVDSLSQGLDPKQSVRVATVVSGTLASSFANGQTVDGVTLATNDRILIKNQGTASENGIYVVNVSGAPTRATDMDAWAEVPGAFVFVETSGSTQADTGWVCTADQGGTLGSTAVTWVQFSGAGTYTAGTGLTLTGTQFSLTSPVAVGTGGTGTSSTPSNGQLLIGNGTGYALATLTDGTGISITEGAGTITVSNTGVTSVALSLPSFITVSGSPVTTTGTLTGTLATQANNTFFAGPTTGGPLAPTFRTIALGDLQATALQLYDENPSTPTAPDASGANAVALGTNSTASAIGSFAVGDGAVASLYGARSFANGVFATDGDAQQIQLVLRGTTTTNSITEIFLDGLSSRMVMPNNSMWTFSVQVSARRTDATGGGAGYRVDGVIRKDTSSASTTLIGAVAKSVLGETNTAWDVSVDADTTNGSLRVRVTGENSKTIRWVASVVATQVTN